MRGLKKLLGIIFREPLIQFAVPALLIFFLYSLVSPTNQQEIIVTSEIVESLVRNQEQVLGRELSTDEREAIVENYIDEEILYREARKRGLDISDGKIRNQLVNKMLFLVQGEASEPTEGDLEKFYEKNKQFYTKPSTVSFEHSFFQSEPVNPTYILKQLETGVSPDSIGDKFWLGTELIRYSEQELSSILGKEFAENVIKTEPGEWRGPIRSGRGFHYIKVTERYKPELITVDELGSTLREDWYKTQSALNRTKKLSELRRNYKIDIKYGKRK